MTSDRRFKDNIERLRSMERIVRTEPQRVVELCLEGILARSVLDVGTGSGLFAEAFGRHGLKVAGVDVNPEMIEAAREFLPTGEFRLGAMEKLPFEDKSFDLVFMGHVLHEADDYVKALAESRRVGWLRTAVLEHPYKQQDFGPPMEHRLRPEQVQDFAEKAGLQNMTTIKLTHLVLYLFDIV